MQNYEKIPEKIENKSFEIIENEIKTEVPEELKDIVYRVVHATADFEYPEILEFVNFEVPDLSGSKIYADTQMILAGINKHALKRDGIEIKNYTHEPDVVEKSKENKTTRSAQGIKKAVEEAFDVYVIGNAPTALFELIENIKAGKIHPKLIVGVPVGFVGATESKEALDEIEGIPFIRTNGRKGGSTVAVAIINGILYKKGRT